MTTTEAALRDALEKCRDQFRFYEANHAAKGNLDGDAKARTNCEFAEMCDRALSQPSPASSAAGEDLREACAKAAESEAGAYSEDGEGDYWIALRIAAKIRALSLSSGEPASSTAGEEKCSACLGENKAQGEYRCLQCDGTGLAKDNVWGEPASVAVEEPTAKGDRVAGLMREYFEAHKSDKWDGFTADNLMIGLLNIALREYRLVEPSQPVVAEEPAPEQGEV